MHLSYILYIIILGDGMKLVSIIVPVYNRENSIVRCYNSLIKQSYNNIEIIFVDDGSTDDSLKVMKSFNDSRVLVLSQENAGPSEARRYGFNNSSGEYICFVDSDDSISKDYISRLVKTLEDNNCDICLSRIGLHVNYPVIKKIMFKVKKQPKFINLSNQCEYLPALSQGVVGKLFRRKILKLEKIEFRANEDLVIMYPLYAKLKYILVDNSAIYHNYYSRNSQRNLLFGYKFENMYNTFGTLKLVYEEYKNMGLLNDYYYALEMLFIRNILERVNNLSDSVSDKIYLYKFVDVVLDYLEYFFPDWDRNIYYLSGFKLGEITDRLRIYRARKIIVEISRKRVELELEEIYDKYKKIEDMYERVSK